MVIFRPKGTTCWKDEDIEDDRDEDPPSEGAEESVDSWEDLQRAYPDRIKVFETSKCRLFLFASLI